MDRLRELANGRGILRGLAGFAVFSAIVFLIGWALGVFDYDPDDDGGTKVIYQPPAGERRY